MTGDDARARAPVDDGTSVASEIRLAVVGPAFFSYRTAISDTLRQRGYRVMEFDEKHSNRPLAKLLYRLGAYPRKFGPRARHLRMIEDHIRDEAISDTLLINTEAIDRSFVERLKRAGVRVHLYMWDGVDNKPGFVALLDLLDTASSFDPDDCERLGLTYIPLFAEEIFDAARKRVTSSPRYDICFCGTIHSSRVRIVAMLLAAARGARVRAGLMLYYHSRWLLLAKGLVQPFVWRVSREVSYEGFPKSAVADMVAGSSLALDIPHHGQSGLTARTFEVLAAGSRLLTFHPSTRERLPADLQDRVMVVKDITAALAVDFAGLAPLPPLTEEQVYYLSLNRFVDSLLTLARVPHRFTTGVGGGAPDEAHCRPQSSFQNGNHPVVTSP